MRGLDQGGPVAHPPGMDPEAHPPGMDPEAHPPGMDPEAHPPGMDPEASTRVGQWPRSGGLDQGGPVAQVRRMNGEIRSP